MKKQQNAPSELAGPRKYILICLLAALPIYILSVTYTKTVTTKDDEEAALIATVLCLGGIYIGRYFSQVWQSKPIPSWLIALLSIINVSALVWLFVHAEFPLRDRVYLNLLLFELPVFILSVTTGMLIKLSRLSVQNQLQEAKALTEQSQSELHLLQSQLSPHFLFNTLNNLYGLSISQPEKTPALLLKLSDLLRYSVYEAKELFVPLKDELAYIDNYIEFETIRIGNKLGLTTSIENVINTDVKIAPMLLIVFIENAFKHSKNTTDHKIAIDITLKLWGNSILFSVKNSYTTLEDKRNTLEKSSGLGLANVQKRLDLLYPNAYDLAIQDADGFYSVQLQLRIK
ncbi:sensor histidine kinase [Spirosoma validum]|uniref:Histidine kinase n=1 Tax=Spirosoma validum TaxID=2771355 RepID=A0A927B270_9BACT|nr:histidine kinase [Spirosoma validum]MBD2754221.1 histidine kinase [Spirosoma validum]